MGNMEESFLEKLENMQKHMPGIILPSMGIIDNNSEIVMDNSTLFEEEDDDNGSDNDDSL